MQHNVSFITPSPHFQPIVLSNLTALQLDLLRNWREELVSVKKVQGSAPVPLSLCGSFLYSWYAVSQSREKELLHSQNSLYVWVDSRSFELESVRVGDVRHSLIHLLDGHMAFLDSFPVEDDKAFHHYALHLPLLPCPLDPIHVYDLAGDAWLIHWPLTTLLSLTRLLPQLSKLPSTHHFFRPSDSFTIEDMKAWFSFDADAREIAELLLITYLLLWRHSDAQSVSR